MFQNNLLMAAASISAGGITVDNSVRYNDDDSPRLYRTPTLAGNRFIGSISLWYKRCNLGSIQQLFNSGAGNDITFNASDQLTFIDSSGVSYITTQVFRDPTAWGHLLFAWDTTLTTAGDRLRIYHNGVEITAFGTETNPDQGDQFGISNTVRQTIGANESDTEEFDGYISQFYHIDGRQLTPTSFGEFNDNGIWRPIEYEGDGTGATQTVTNTASPVSTEQLSDYSGQFDSIAIGTASSDRIIVMMPLGQGATGGARNVSTLTVGGITARKIVAADCSIENGYTSEMWFAPVPTGTTADIDVVWNTTMYSCSFGIWAITGGNVLWDAQVDIDSEPMTANLTLPDNSCGIAGGSNYNSGTYTWVGLTEDFDKLTGASSGNLTGASDVFASAAVQAISITSTAAQSRPTACFISFAPGTDYGTNGFFLDFADSSEFGLYGTGANVLTDHPSAEGDYVGDVSDFTFDGDDIVGAVDKYINLPGFFVGDCEFEFTIASGSDYGAMGFFDATEVGSLTGNAGKAGMETMTNSWYFEPDDTLSMDVRHANADVAGYTFTEPSTQKLTRVGAVFKVYLDDVLQHTYTQEFSDPVGIAIGGHSAQNWDDIKWSGDNYGQFISSGLAAADQVTDTPTKNFCTMSPIDKSSSITLSDGNLTTTGSGGWYHGRGTLFATSGKWYYEWIPDSGSYALAGWMTNVGSDMHEEEGDPETAQYRGIGAGLGVTLGNQTTITSVANFAVDDVIMMAIDIDTGEVWVGVNGTWEDDEDPGAGGTATGTWTSMTGTAFTPWTGQYSNANSFNFGQTAFAHTIPTGFSAWSTANLATPTILDGTANFQTTLYTGDGSTRNIDQTGNSTFQPDMVWIKNRSAADVHSIFDATRGATKYWQSNTHSIEITNADSLTSFDSDGFGLGTGAGGWNDNTENFVAWQWLAGGGAGSSNTAGSINTITTTVNTTAGISISTFTGNATGGATIGHGLGAAPEFMIAKSLTGGHNNIVYFENLGGHYGTYMGLTNAPYDIAIYWNDVDPTSSLITLGNGATNTSSVTMLIYAFTSIEGFSRFSYYIGNGLADGAFVYTGFKPVYVMIRKTSSTGNWVIVDSQRSPYNEIDDQLLANTTAAETTGSEEIDFLSNGFKCRTADTDINASSAVYAYTAFAEYPFGGDGVTPSTAF